MKELAIRDELKGLEESRAAQIEAVFTPMVEMLKSFEAQFDEIVKEEITQETCARAKRLRLDIAKVRTSADKVRADQKAEYLRAGNAIQGVYNILKFAVVEKEDKLKDIELHFERIEEEKKARIQAERELELSKYDLDGSTMDLGNMDDMVWNNFLSGTKSNFEAIMEAERKAEEQRIAQAKAEEEERIRIKEENERLKAEREEREKQIEAERIERERLEKIERDKQEKIRLEQEKALAKERAEAERKRLVAEKEAREKQAALEAKAREEKRLQDEIIRKEREERARIEAEFAKQKAAEEAERIRIADAKKRAELAPDKEKLQELLSVIQGYSFVSSKAKRVKQAAYDTVFYGIKSLDES